MSEKEIKGLTFANDLADALVAYLVGQYMDVSTNKLGRTILQKLCYFAEASGVPLGFRFAMYHYGPFSSDAFRTVDALLVDDVIRDASDDPSKSDYQRGDNWRLLIDSFGCDIESYRRALDRIATTFSELDPTQMELVSTIHYVHNSHREWSGTAPPKEEVIESVFGIKKGKFGTDLISRVYDVLSEARLLRDWRDPSVTA